MSQFQNIMATNGPYRAAQLLEHGTSVQIPQDQIVLWSKIVLRLSFVVYIQISIIIF